jgi:nitrogen fixation/metabolism regulation signal transduction histidine kinase
LWFGQDHKQETLDEFFRTQLTEIQRKRIAAACVDMWRPFTTSIEQWVPHCSIVYDKFHVLQHANRAIEFLVKAQVSPLWGEKLIDDAAESLPAVIMEPSFTLLMGFEQPWWKEQW